MQPPVFAEPPLLPALPKPKWLLAVYARDVLGRLHEVKAKITSVFGCVLKMDSTKKVSQPCLYTEYLPDMDVCVLVLSKVPTAIPFGTEILKTSISR